MVKNACLNQLKHKALIDISSIDFVKNLSGEEALYALDFTAGADYVCLEHELAEQINKVMNDLPARCREVFVLSRMDGLKNKEIALQLNISTTMVEKHIAKAIAVFSAKFKDDIG